MTSHGRDVAVVGMSGKFPGADGIAELWRNLCAGTESIGALSEQQLRRAGATEADLRDSSYVRAAALLNGVDRFDPEFFKIAPSDAELMDPQMRLLLQCAWEALEDAGHATREPQNIGVFAGAGGVTTSYFANFVNVNRRFERVTAGPAHLGNDKDFIATYISYKLNLTGPSVTVQTACSTSLVALHQARMSLLNGECDMALAGGVTVRVPHELGYHYRDGYIFSRTGHIRTFDAAADGVVFGSGLGLVLIKRLEDAIRDGNRIYAVIKGTAITNDGKGKMSYAASSAKGQIACIGNALRDAGIQAQDIGFVESHGTGTAMGDPEEVKALSAAFKAQTDRKGYCALGAVKANIGHLEAAAGIVGFIKAALAVERGVIPPLVHYSTPNPRIRFESTPFYVNTSLRQWDEGDKPRRAAINSLGVGGTNAFVILEEYVPARTQIVAPSPAPVIVPISAKSSASLTAYVAKLAGFLDAPENATIDIRDLAYTLQVGRVAMDQRVAFISSSLQELRAQLLQYLKGTASQSIVLPTQPADAEREQADIRAGMECRDLTQVAQGWADRCDVPWAQLYDTARKPSRIHLPTYVFATERYWIDAEPAATERAVLHPLLHANTSDLNEQKYASTFDGGEFFLNDHQVRTTPAGESEPRVQKILPGVAYLEMARAALERAMPDSSARTIELRNVMWVRPIAVSEATQVGIALFSGGSTLDFEVYSEADAVHCQGQAAFVSDEVAPLDIAALQAQMRQGEWTVDDIYAAMESMGLCYGPAHRALTRIERGERQLLAHLTLPASVAASHSEFVLHPSVMDGALQATNGLLFDLKRVPDAPIVPFSLDSVRVVAPCTREMLAWVRYSPSSGALVKLDIDLCEPDGKVCVQLRGFASRSMSKSARPSSAFGYLLAAGEWQPRSDTAAIAATYAERHVIVCGLPQVGHEELASTSREVQHVPLDVRKNIAEQYTDVTVACFERVQRVLKSRPQEKILLQLVAPASGDSSVFAGLSALLRTARLENPQLIGQVVLVPLAIDADALSALLGADQDRPSDVLIKHENGERHVFGWCEQDSQGANVDGAVFKSRGVYLITGGLGGLGTLFAKEILEHVPDARVILTGRRAPSGKHQTNLESLKALGSGVEYRLLDLEDATQVEQTIASVREQHKRIDGIFHCAGMVADNFILKKSAAELQQVLAPKVRGTHHLDQATRDLDLDFIALFSSLTSAVGNAGQADYAAANGFMDQFAGYRNRLVKAGQRHGRTVAIHWPYWQDGGMQLDAAGLGTLHETTGIHPMTASTGIQAFYESLASERDELLPMQGDLAKIRHILTAGLAVANVPGQPPVASSATADEPKNLSELTESYLCRQLSTLLKLPPHKVHARAPLEDYGIDSILALSFTRVLEKDFGSLPKTLFFEYLSIRDLAGYFVGAHTDRLRSLFSIGGGSSAIRVEAPPQVSTWSMPVISRRAGRRRFVETEGASASSSKSFVGEPIAIIGLSGRYPQSRDVDAFWVNLRDGKDCILEVPPERWDWREFYSDDRTRTDRHFSKWGGFIEGVDEFDPRFFNISPREAATIDPQERLFLQHCWMAVEDAGYTRERLQVPREGRLSGQVGVYAGVMYGEYNLSGSLASIANRVSYVLNLHGPSITLDTMCSSSLTAIHLACQDLKLGRTDLAIAGGVNVSIHPNKYLMLSAGQFISSDGHCQSFGEGGDGYIPAEGVGAVILKRLAEAQRDGDHIYGIIRGSSVNHGGKTNGYTVPNPVAQAAVIGDVLIDAQIDARYISYLEAHGTGTKLGDPIEIAALSKAFQRTTRDTGFCAIGSAKSNIGHAESAAGVAGLTKVLLQMKHRQIVPSLHSQRLNPHIDFAATPFVVNQRLREWAQPVVDGQTKPRIAGISSFGAGGANAHLIVEEYVTQPTALLQPGEVSIPLSARTADQLRQKIEDMQAFLRRSPSIDLNALAFTLQTGREALAERLGFVVSSVEALAKRLQECLSDKELQVEGVFRGKVDSQRDALSMITADADFEATVERWIERKKLDKLLSVWVQGFNVDWRKLWPDAQPRRISLPTYPFATERYWMAGPSFASATVSARPGDAAQAEVSTKLAADDRVRSAEPVLPAKPTGIALIAPEQASFTVQPFVRQPIRLEAVEQLLAPSKSASVPLEVVEQLVAPLKSASVPLLDAGDGVFVVSIDTADTDQLLGALAQAERQTALKVLILDSTSGLFLGRGREATDDAIERGLFRAIASFPAPVIASLQGDALGAGFLVAALCDFMVLNRDARYAFTLPEQSLYPTAEEFALFSERFGEARATQFLYTSPMQTGAGLSEARWGCPVLSQDQILGYARKLAVTIAAMPRESVQLLKAHLARDVRARVEALRPAGLSSNTHRAERPTATRFSAARFLQLDSQPNGVLLVTASAVRDEREAQSLIEELSHFCAELGEVSDYRAVVVASEASTFLGGLDGAVSDDAILELRDRLHSIAIPVIGALSSGAMGSGWLLSQYFDACVYGVSSDYSASTLLESAALSREAAAILPVRFGAALGSEIILTGARYSGRELMQRAGAVTVAPDNQVLARALDIASAWSKFPDYVLREWKGQRIASLEKPLFVERIDEHSCVEQLDQARPIPLTSTVIRATAHPRGIVVVSMEDRGARNRFSDAFIAGMNEVFAHIENTPAYKVVILTGYDNYFASGGTKEALLAIQQGTLKYTDVAVFELPVRCKLPVIAAMQGHTVGAGWSLGLCCDLSVASEESIYSTRFMSFGFTPGAASTLVFPHKLGRDLSRELLMTAQESSGRDLRERGITIPIVARREALPTAMAMAEALARRERNDLIALKRQLSRFVSSRLDETYRYELEMQERTFVGQHGVLERIRSSYMQDESEQSMSVVTSETPPTNSHIAEKLASLTASLGKLLADELYLREDEIDEHTQFIDMGLDSITGVTWIRKINEKYGLAIEATKVYSHPTLAEISRHVKDELMKQAPASVAPSPTPVSKPAPKMEAKRPASVPVSMPVATRSEKIEPAASRQAESQPTARPVRDAEPIAVIGMAGQFPKAADLETFWNNIASGVDCVTVIPKQRWNVDAFFQEGAASAGKTMSKWMGALENYDRFDPLFFAISPTDAEFMDPQQRLFLQACWHAIEDAGYSARSLSGTKTGVFAGCAAGDYYREPGSQRLNAQQLMGNAPSILAARISYFLNLQGPCVSVDTACSSSLVSLATACDSLSSGASDVALAGGVQVMAGPAMHIMTSQAGMLSADGKCFAFDDRANGFVPAEAVGVVMLKRLADAERDRDFIYGVIRGWGVNQDGKTNGITAPNPESQTRLQQSVYDRYQIDPAQIQLIEAHGTGTKLGDPIEIEGLKAAFGKYTRKTGYCAVGSVKSNMGHALNAAGISGFIKLMLALKHRKLPPTLHFDRLNRHISLEASPFYINGELRDWPLNGAPLRQAAISSFGFSGTNCHMVVSEAPQLGAARSDVTTVLQNGRMAIPLSARTQEQLKQRAVDLLQFIRARSSGELDLQTLAYTLQIGRDAMDHRLGIMAGSLEELADRLVDYLDRSDAAEGCYRGQVKQSKEALHVITHDEVIRDTIIEKYLARGEVDKLLQLWTKGLEIDWNRLYGERKPRRIALPVYPFAQERYWLESTAVGTVTAARMVESHLHPLLHTNTSDFGEQSYSAQFDGSEPFLADHLVAEKKVLPGVAYLEMARAAIEDATGTKGAVTLRNVVWSRPVIVTDEPMRVRIALHPEASNDVVYQVTSGGDEDAVVHSSGRASLGVQDGASSVDLSRVQARTQRQHLSREQYYRALEEIGLKYGESHRRILELHVGEGEALAKLAPLEPKDSSYVLNPGLLDAAFHASLTVLESDKPTPMLPFALERLDILGDCNDSTWAWVRLAEGSIASDKVRKLDIDVFDAEGGVSVRVRGLSARAMEAGVVETSANTTRTLMLEPMWFEQPAVASPDARAHTERFVFLCGFDSIALALQRQMTDTTVMSLSAAQATLAGRFHAGAVQLFECLQRVMAGSALIQVLVPDSTDGEVYAALWSLLQSAHLENSKIVGQVIAMDPATSVAEIAAKLRENESCGQVGQIRYEHDRRYVKQLAEVSLPMPIELPWCDGGTYLITGGAGGLGMIFAKSIAANAANVTVVLTGRSELDEAGRRRIRQLQTPTSKVEYRRLDVTDADAVSALISSIQREHGGLTGILHCAGIIRDNYIAKKSTEDFDAVLAPKIAGTFNLDEASRALDLDCFVLFSSIGAALGGAGQSDYAVANAFMDGYASYRNRLVAGGQRSGKSLSINWPLWKSEGMGVDAAKEAFFKAHFGMVAMTEERGLQAFSQVLRAGKPQVMVMDGLLQRMRQRLLPGRSAVEPPKQEIARPAPVVGLDDDMLVSRIQETLRKKVARFLKMHEDALDFDTELTEFGFDSISLTEFTNLLNQDLKLDLTPTVFFEYPTLASLAAHLAAARRDLFVGTITPRTSAPAVVELAATIEAPAPAVLKRGPRFSVPQVAQEMKRAEDPIAIIGMSGKFPQAATLEEFWENLRTGRDCIEEVPASRWDWRELYGDPRTEDNKTNIKWGGFIDGVDEFDPLFFGISPREAQLMDPQQRLLMTHAWKVIEAAGYAPESLSGSSVGIFVGTYTSGYQELAARAGVPIDGYSSTGMSTSIGPNRMSYFLNLHGPSEPIETACSSSLVAIHRAVHAIKSGSCEAAIAGGVNAIVNPWNHIAFSKAGMLSEDGRCKTFSDRANGYVRGEGVGILFLKKLSAAERDGDPILAVIRGSAENHGGRASSLTAPNPKAQASLLQAAYRAAGVDPRSIGYIEAHGTGTELGDPIEIDALKNAFQTLYSETAANGDPEVIDAHCGLGSLKSNIGHLELAAGVAGVIKVLLQLKHRTRVKTLHCDTINPYIDLNGSPFYIARENDEWPRLKDRSNRELPRRAGVSSFGFGGVNAHVVLEEYVPMGTAPRLEGGGPHLIVLSAKTEVSLRQAAENLAAYLEGEGRVTDLASVAYTLQVGRNGMEQRLAMLVRSREELLEKLTRFANGDEVDAYRGEIKRSQDALAVFTGDEDLREAVDVWIQKGKYEKLLSLWVKGLAFDWNRLYGERKPARVSLPTYAFARERVWIEPSATSRPARSTATRDVLHPLLHLNTSNLEQQSYRTTLTGTEHFLADHQVRTEHGSARPVLPAVAYLEMARAAIEQALPDRRADSALELTHATWLQPCVVTSPRELTLALYPREQSESIDFEILSHIDGEASVHCQGRATPGDTSAVERFDVEELRERIRDKTLPASEIYAALESMGLKYGPAHRTVATVRVAEGELLAHLTLPSTLESTRAQYQLHPSLMDGALQASIAFLIDRGTLPNLPWVPFALESARVLAPCPSEMYAWIRRVESTDTLLKVDLDLFDRYGNACVTLRGFSARALQPDSSKASFDDSLYHRIIDSVMNNELSIDEAVERSA